MTAKRKSGKAKFITADGISEIRNVVYPPMPTIRFSVRRKFQVMESVDVCDQIILNTREYELHGRDDDGSLVYREVLK